MSLEKEFGQAKKQIDDALRMCMKGTALALFASIIRDTPADTGRLRGNWDVSFDHATNASVLAYDKTGAATISKATAKLGAYKTNDDIYMTNNVLYAVYVEDGTDRMQGHHMVSNAKDSFNTQLEKNAAKYRIR